MAIVDDRPAADAATTVGRRRVRIRSGGGRLTGRVVELLAAHTGIELVDEGPADTVVDLVLGDHDLVAGRRRSVTVGAAELVADLERTGADHAVVLSSAMVYGAVENNAVPLTEESVLRPDQRFAYARQLAAAEWLLEDWRLAQPDRSVAVLRPAVIMAGGASSGLARALAAGLGQRFGRYDPAAQFVHLDDVAAAVALAVADGLDGVFNVAPDGSVPGDRLLALAGDGFRVPLPDRWAEVVEALRWRLRRGPIPPGLRAYTRYPWTISNDRLKRAGWVPTVTNEQAYVEGTEGSWWSTLTPQRRQELALGGAIILALGIVAAVIGLGIVAPRRGRQRRN